MGKELLEGRKKVTHRTATADDKKLQFYLKNLEVNNISGIKGGNIFMNQRIVIYFNNHKVQVSLTGNTFPIIAMLRQSS